MKKITALALVAFAPSLAMAAGTLTVNGVTVGTYDSAQTVTTDVLSGSVSVSATNFVATGSGTGGSTNPPPTYTIGGTVSGLTASGLTLLNNGSNSTAVAANATGFTFSTPTSTYNVTVGSNPSGLTCSVSNASGTATANVTNVAVSCATAPATPANVTLMTGITYPLGGATYPSLGQFEIKAFPYTPIAGLQYAKVSSIVTSSTGGVSRSTWISATPGGPALTNNPACSAYGLNTTSYYGTITGAYGCQLQAGVQYYINVQNTTVPNGSTTTCPSSNCGFGLGVSGGGS